jgi:hypothetical protein
MRTPARTLRSAIQKLPLETSVAGRWPPPAHCKSHQAHWVGWLGEYDGPGYYKRKATAVPRSMRYIYAHKGPRETGDDHTQDFHSLRFGVCLGHDGCSHGRDDSHDVRRRVRAGHPLSFSPDMLATGDANSLGAQLTSSCQNALLASMSAAVRSRRRVTARCCHSAKLSFNALQSDEK